jgi:uncharacterized cupredoxin-like copper-binding protein
MRTPIAVIGGVALVAGLAACGSDSKSSASDNTVTFKAIDFGWDMPDKVTIEPGVTRVVLQNAGQEYHELGLVKVKAGTTAPQVSEVLSSDDPDAGKDIVEGDPEADLGLPSFVSPGSSAVTFTDELTPGTYALFCFVPTKADGAPHFTKGMLKVIEVASAGDKAVAAPEADVTVTAKDFSFDVPAFKSGKQVVAVTNTGTVPHEASFGKLNGQTIDQAYQSVGAFFSGQSKDYPTTEIVGGVTVPPGETRLLELDLAKGGQYGIVSGANGDDNGQNDDFSKGMKAEFTVG